MAVPRREQSTNESERLTLLERAQKEFEPIPKNPEGIHNLRRQIGNSGIWREIISQVKSLEEDPNGEVERSTESLRQAALGALSRLLEVKDQDPATKDRLIDGLIAFSEAGPGAFDALTQLVAVTGERGKAALQEKIPPIPDKTRKSLSDLALLARQLEIEQLEKAPDFYLALQIYERGLKAGKAGTHQFLRSWLEAIGQKESEK